MDEWQKIAVIIPTYNERENLREVIERIASLKLSSYAVVVIDDNSPDGTGKLAEELKSSFPITVMHREKKMGLGTAYSHAFRVLLSREHPPDIIIQMDADLSHDPQDIPRFLEAIKHEDMVLGSRYVAGGNVKNWNITRRFISRLSNLYARVMLSLPFYDLTGGFKCWRSEVLKNIDIENTSSIGYNFQIETTFRAYKAGFSICEIPITFTERTFGKSKFSIPIIFESFWKVITLRLGG